MAISLRLVVLAFILMQLAQAENCDNAKHPLIILPGIMASQINATYNGFAAGTPCLGRKKMHTIWPPTAGSILPTGLNCWMYMVQPRYSPRSKRFSNARGVKVVVEPGGRSGTEYGLWQSSYSNLTSYLSSTFNYTLGKDMFGAPFDWRLHLSGLERAGQMRALAGKIQAAVDGNCGKKAVLIGHSMGGLVSLALLHRDPRWTSRYVQGLVTVSAPFGGTTDQAIAVRLGAVDFNINDWVKMPMARAAEEVKARHSADVAVAVASIQQEADADAAAAAGVDLIGATADSELDVSAAAAAQDGQPVQVPRQGKAAAAKAAAKAAAAKAGQAAVATASFLNIDKLVSNYISSIFYKATVGLPGLSMLLPYSSAYGRNRRIIVTGKQTYTTNMMQHLMDDIGDSVSSEAWKQVHELDALLAKGGPPNIPTHCLYAVGKPTTLTWSFPNIKEKRPLLSSSPLVTTGGDGTVSMQSLKQCYRITDAANITELGDFGHLEVLKHPDGLAQLGQVLARLLGLDTNSSSSSSSSSEISGGASSASNSSSSADASGLDANIAANATQAADTAAGDVIAVVDRTADMIEVTTSDDVIEVVGAPTRSNPFTNTPWEGRGNLPQPMPGYVGIAAVPVSADQAAPQQRQQQHDEQQGSSPAGSSSQMLQPQAELEVQDGQVPGQNSTV